MSAAALLLQFIFAVLGFLLSLNGIAMLGFGLVGFLLMPIIPRILGVGYGLAGVHIGLAKWLVGRVAIVVSEHNDLLWKRMSFDDLGVEEIQFGNSTKTFEDPAQSLHYWGRATFALADEVTGVLFDPRHAALGERELEAREKGITTRKATPAERKAHDIIEWTLGTFEMPTKPELVNLSAVRAIVDGGERAEYSERMEEYYKLSRKPFGSSTPMLRLMMPVISFLAVFGGMWLIASQGSGAGGARDTVSFGTMLLFGGTAGLAQSARTAVSSAWTLIKYAILVAMLPAAFVALALVAGPFSALVMGAVWFLGFLIIPVMCLFFKPVNTAGGALSKYVLLMTGFLAYDRPVLEWTRNGYHLREYADVETDVSPTWYAFAGGVLGFTYPPEAESWGPDVMTHDQVDSYGEAVITDGGESASIPDGYVRAPSFQRDLWAAFVPQTPTPDKYYLNSGIALQRFNDSSIGEKSMKTLLWAKEEYGAGEFGWMNDKRLAILTVFMAMVGVALGTVVFFL